MSGGDSVIEHVKDRFERISAWALNSPWLERLARFGYASKGLVYLIVGGIAVQAAFGASGDTVDMRGALHAMLQGPFGAVLVGVVAVGLAGYVLWRFAQALVDPEHKGTGVKGIILRSGYIVSGAIFAKLVFEAVEDIVEWSNSPHLTPEDWTAFVLAQPLGRWLVGIVGALVIGFGLFEFYAAYTARFLQKFDLNTMNERGKRWMKWFGQFGLAARGVVFTIIGVFLIQAALQANAEQAAGLRETLHQLAGQPFGPWVLGAVALGLIAYGVYQLAEARYRRIVVS